MTRIVLGVSLSLVALYAMAALDSGFDRMSAFDPAGAWQPELLRVDASRVAAAAALSAGDVPKAERFAREALLRAPTNRQTTALLATALLLSGEDPAARRAFAIAHRGGWRDPLVQSYWLNNSLVEGRPRNAVEHFEAIVRSWPNFPATDQLLAGVMANAEARAILIERLSKHTTFARALFTVDATDSSHSVVLRADLSSDPAFKRQPLDCEILEPVIKGLKLRRMIERATVVRRMHCRAGASSREMHVS